MSALAILALRAGGHAQRPAAGRRDGHAGHRSRRRSVHRLGARARRRSAPRSSFPSRPTRAARWSRSTRSRSRRTADSAAVDQTATYRLAAWRVGSVPDRVRRTYSSGRQIGNRRVRGEQRRDHRGVRAPRGQRRRRTEATAAGVHVRAAVVGLGARCAGGSGHHLADRLAVAPASASPADQRGPVRRSPSESSPGSRRSGCWRR